MFQLIIKLIGFIFVLVGVILIYDASLISKRFYDFGDLN